MALSVKQLLADDAMLSNQLTLVNWLDILQLFDLEIIFMGSRVEAPSLAPLVLRLLGMWRIVYHIVTRRKFPAPS